MAKLEFQHHWAPARKDIFDFLREEGEGNVLKKIKDNPKAWIEELNIISHLLTRIGITGMQTPLTPPESDLRNLGKGAYFYKGEDKQFRGLWIREGKKKKAYGQPNYWMNYKLGERASLHINKSFSDIAVEDFLPENFEKRSEKICIKGCERRPISRFSVNVRSRSIDLYAKGTCITVGKYYTYSKPSYRLTHISSIQKDTSKREQEITIELSNMGVKVPKIIGYYEAPVEEFLFLEEVKGESPFTYLKTHRDSIIKQDAEILANLCKAGYRKCGFPDFDDKIFDGKDLYLIDVDECRDLYFPNQPDFRRMLLNPNDIKGLNEFRRFQVSVFETMLKDSLYQYREDMTPTNQDQRAYIIAFYDKLEWKTPDRSKIKQLTTFPKDYQTIDSYMSMMCDTD